MHRIVCPAIVGYYHIPLAWCARAPTPSQWRHAANGDLLDIVYEKTLEGGIRVRVRRDGLFWFDCNRWSPGTYTEIPAYSTEAGSVVPNEVIKAEILAEERAAQRYTLVNAFNLFLNSAQSSVGYTVYAVAPPVQAQHLVTLTSFANPLSLLYGSEEDPYCAFVNKSILSLIGRRQEDLPNRRVIPFELVDVACGMLEASLGDANADSLKIAELLYLAHSRFAESDFANSLILAWAACEKMLMNRWFNFISEKRSDIDGQPRINKKRKKRLEGEEFKASIVSEILELHEYIDKELLDGLNDARKARNDWLHALSPISNETASKALRAAASFYRINTEIPIKPTISRVAPGTGGVPPRMYEYPS